MKRTCLSLLILPFVSGVVGAESAPPATMPIQFSGEFRLRPEYRRDPDFSNATSDAASFVGSRIRLGANAQPRPDVAVKITFQDTRVWGQEASPVGLTATAPSNFDIHEGYVEFQNLLNTPIAVRAGRQELNYGDQRLVGALNWSNNARAFDAFKAFMSNDAYNADLWTAKRKENDAAGGAPSKDRDFSGLYFTAKKVLPKGVIDLYVLNDREGDTPVAARPRSIVTVGTRIAGTMAGFDYTAEVPYQFGDTGTVLASSENVTLSAWALAARGGYTFAPHETRFGLEYDFASGSNNAASRHNHTFNNLYPTNHPFYGYMDDEGWRNMKAVNAVFSAKPSKPSFVSIGYWNFRLAEPYDGWYDATGAATGTLRSASPTNTETHVGDEVDLLLRYATSPEVTWEAGASHFFAGPFIKDRVGGASDGSDWTYVMTTVKF